MHKGTAGTSSEDLILQKCLGCFHIFRRCDLNILIGSLYQLHSCLSKQFHHAGIIRYLNALFLHSGKTAFQSLICLQDQAGLKYLRCLDIPDGSAIRGGQGKTFSVADLHRILALYRRHAGLILYGRCVGLAPS